MEIAYSIPPWQSLLSSTLLLPTWLTYRAPTIPAIPWKQKESLWTCAEEELPTCSPGYPKEEWEEKGRMVIREETV